MFYYIKGTLELIGDDFVVIDNHDIGYKIRTSNESMDDLKNKSEKVMVYTQMIHREDDMSIFGFSTKEELKMFQQLMTVTGIGAKVSLGILSSIPLAKLIGIIVGEDVVALTKAQGVGKKTAQRIILELKDKLDHQMADFEPTLFPVTKPKGDDIEEAIEALIALGYGKGEASDAVNAVKNSSKTIEETIKNALRFLVR